MINKRKAELLAPAGSFDSLKAAVAAGADAIYMGGSRFGARAYAQNAAGEEMVEAIRYAHLHGCRLYMTVNTLFKEKELDELCDYMKPYYEAGLDGVIVQDLGALQVMKRAFPGMELHASTQMNVTGPYFGRELKRLGVTRIVTARELSLEETGCYRTVGVWESDENLKALCAAMNSRRIKQLRYVFGDASEVLSGETMASWITGSSNGQVTLDQEKVAAFVANLAATYDTAGKARTFRGVTGAEYQLTGPYGWKIDQAGEIAALTELIQSVSAWQDGDSADREPVYSQSAVSRTGGDWGNTYVQVDLGGQHVYMVKDGTVVWDAPCVTGNVSKDYTTPAGIYSLTYKEKDRILRGKKLDNGKYEYESHVDYWMPFNGGIGLHDASWRSKFGGTIYQTSGSHGCVNLPPASAATLYDLLYKGIPVICTP